MPLEAIRLQIGSAIEVMIHLGRLRDKSRRVLEVVELVGYKENKMNLNPIYRFVEDAIREDEVVSGKLVSTGNRLKNRDKLELANIREGLPI
jgi:pilus assembly protein CpaF